MRKILRFINRDLISSRTCGADFLKTYEALDYDIQNFTIQRALGHPGELGYFMRKNREWSLRHFMTSERYMVEYLNYEFIPNRYFGCVSA